MLQPIRGLQDIHLFQALSSDITCIPTREGFAYTCTVRDLCSGVILAAKTDSHMKKDLVLYTIRSATNSWRPAKGASSTRTGTTSTPVQRYGSISGDWASDRAFPEPASLVTTLRVRVSIRYLTWSWCTTSVGSAAGKKQCKGSSPISTAFATQPVSRSDLIIFHP